MENMNAGGSAPTMSSGPAPSQVSGPQSGIEINSNFKSDGFSSKGLSMFKDIGKFNSEKPMIDSSKPSFENHTQPHFETPKQETVKSDSIVDINHGKEEPKSMFKDIGHFDPPKSMIDISRPYIHVPEVSHQKPIEQSFRKEEFKTPIMHELKQDKAVEVPATTRTEFENSVVHEEAKHEVQPEVRTEFENAPKEEPQTETLPQGKTETLRQAQGETKPETQTEVQPQPELEVQTKTQQEVKILTENKTETATETLRQAQGETKTETAAQTLLAPELAQEQRISLKKAKVAIKKAVKKALRKKEGQTEKSKEIKSEKNKKQTLEEKAQELFQTRKLKVEEKALRQAQGQEAKKQQDEILYFEKDKKVNTYRTMVATLAAQRIRENGEEINGKNLAEAISSNILQGDKSEVVEGIQDDQSADKVIDEISKVGTITDSETLHRVIRQITDRFTAIRLSFKKNTDAKREDAEQVYGQTLDKVGANFREDRSRGEIVEEENGNLVYYTNRVPQEYDVQSA